MSFDQEERERSSETYLSLDERVDNLLNLPRFPQQTLLDRQRTKFPSSF